MRRAIAGFGLIAGLLAASAAMGHEVTSKGVTDAHPWARATPGGATVRVAFMEIKTAPGTADKLVSASSPAAGRVEVHTHIMDGDVMKMRRLDSLDLEPGKSRILKPSGEHIMMFDLKQPLKEGDLVKLTLVFEKAGPIEIEGSVEPAGAMGPHGMDSQPATDGEMGSHEHMNHH
jgi:periplasmic copper chaperone A